MSFFQAFEELERLLRERNICVAVKAKLTKDSGVAGAGAYDHIVDKLRAKPKARGEHQMQGCPLIFNNAIGDMRRRNKTLLEPSLKVDP